MHDLDVRQSLHGFLQAHFAYDPSTVFADELGILQGRVRVDVAAVNGHLHGFEIKAAADSLDRLPSQVVAYSRVLDCAAVVAADRHLIAADLTVPSWWGIYRAELQPHGLTIATVREGTTNPNVDVRAVAELLWHAETLALLDARGAARGIRSKPRADAWDRLCAVYSLDEIRDAVRSLEKVPCANEPNMSINGSWL
jgi:hypothetical protein